MRCKKPFATLRFAAIVLIITHVPLLFFTDDIANAVSCIFAGITIIAIGYKHGLHRLMKFGVLTALSGFGRPVIEFSQWLDFSNWITLSVMGAVIIITASLIERHGAVLKMKWDRLANSTKK